MASEVKQTTSGVDALVAKIIKDAEDYAASAVADAEQYGKDAVKLAEEQAAEYIDLQRQDAEKSARELVERRHTLANLEAKKNVLGARQEMVETIYRRAVNKLKELPKGEYLKLVDGLIGKYAEKGEIVILSADSPLSAEEVAALDTVKKLSLKVEKGGNFEGGLVLSGAKCDKELSFTALCQSVREKTESEMASRLFD